MKYQFVNRKEEFLIGEILQFSLGAGFQTRNESFPIYNYNTIELNQAKKLRNDIKEFLLNYLSDYKLLREDGHVQKIVDLSDFISEKYGKILYQNRFRIGISQKITNLFLKYLWTINKINMPFHCPIDNIIKIKIEKIVKEKSFTDWTEMDDINEYLDYIEVLKLISKESKLTIAEWELYNWKRR
jgi:hypothetical protein